MGKLVATNLAPEVMEALDAACADAQVSRYTYLKALVMEELVDSGYLEPRRTVKTDMNVIREKQSKG